MSSTPVTDALSPDSQLQWTYNNFIQPTRDDPIGDDYINTRSINITAQGLPPDRIQNGWPETVQIFLDLFAGHEDLGQTTVYMNITGTAGSHGCVCKYALVSGGTMSDGTPIVQAEIGSVNPNVQAGGGNTTSFDGTWVRIQKWDTLVYPTSVSVTQTTLDGGGCWCGRFYGDDPDEGWNSCVVGLQVVWQVQTLNWCTLPDTTNIGMDMCYNFLSNYNVASWKAGLPPGQQETTAVQEYCQRRYADKSLEDLYPCTLPPKDCNICACNLNQEDYSEYMLSLEDEVVGTPPGVMPNCLFPPCKQSAFIMNNLQGCQGPDCINVVSMDSNYISGGVTINQGNQCGDLQPTGDDPAAETGWTTGQQIALGVGIFCVVLLLCVVVYLVAVPPRRGRRPSGLEPVSVGGRD